MIYLVSNQTNAFNNDFKQISIEEGLNKLKDLKYISNDTETTGLSCHSKSLLTIQLGNKDFQVVFDISSYSGKIPSKLAEFLSNFDGIFILQNAKFDLQFYYKQNVILKNVYDTMLAEYILTLGLQDSGRDLQTIVKKYCNEYLDKSVRGEIITKGLNSNVIKYAAYDIVYLEDIMNAQLKLIRNGNLENALKIDNSFVKVLAYIEFCGIKLDWEKWKIKAQEDVGLLQEKEQSLNDWLYHNNYKKYFSHFDLFSNNPVCSINWSSSKQVIPVFEDIGINCTIKVKGESKKTVEEKALKFQIDKFEILKLFYEYQSTKKLVSTYGLSWSKAINVNTKRIHTSFRQIMNTGRLSCGDSRNNCPNLQNLPGDKFTRSCFIAEKGNKIIAADYSAQESIVLANFAQDESLLNFYRKGLKDMHSYVAYLLFEELQTKPQNELTNDDLTYIKSNFHTYRQIAKTAEFAIGYGGNGNTISKNTGCTPKRGIEVYNNYFKAFSGLKNYFTLVLNKVKKYGYIEYNHITHRKFFIHHNNAFVKFGEDYENDSLHPDDEQAFKIAQSEIQRLAQNYPIQGSSADCSKLAGSIFFKIILERGWFGIVKIVNMVHDEFVVEAPEHLAKEVAYLLVDSMRKAGEVFCKIIPLDADVVIADHWVH